MKQQQPPKKYPALQQGIPSLDDYGLCPRVGFLSPSTPLNALADPYYEKWEYIGRNLQTLQLSGRLRLLVDRLPVLSCERLITQREVQRAYSLLAFICHSYVWGGRRPAEVVPPSLSIPFKTLCDVLELPMVATYAAVVLWNFTPIAKEEPYDQLSNLATNLTFTGSLDESWFYLISVAIEARGGPLITLALETMMLVQEGNSKAVALNLSEFAIRISQLGEVLTRMYERCDPYVFYHHIRRYLAGSKNVADQGLPYGIIFDDGSGHVAPVQYAGGSNGQSSLIQFLDIVLDVKHLSETARFVHDMRRYMPGPHRRFLEDVAEAANIRGYVESHSENEELRTAYESCLAAVANLRNKHLEIVSRYIIAMKNGKGRGPPCEHIVSQEGLLAASTHDMERKGGSKSNVESATGTGGTDIIPLLKQMRNATIQRMLLGRDTYQPEIGMPYERVY